MIRRQRREEMLHVRQCGGKHAAVAATRGCLHHRCHCSHRYGNCCCCAITVTAVGTVVAAVAAAAAAAAGTGCVASARPTASYARSAAIPETKRNCISHEPEHSAMDTFRHMSRPTLNSVSGERRNLMRTHIKAPKN